ncbi:MAG: endonuclease/exonuclease/phosphatase family protein [Phycisphaeraceae bacterium]
MSEPHAPSHGLRLVSYNILDGALGRYDPVYETLAYLDADVVAVCEADDPKGLAYIADKLSMEHLLAEANHSSHHVAVLTRLPVEQMINLGVKIPHLENAAMQVVLRPTPDAAPVRLIVAHLTAGLQAEAEQKRLAELDSILAFLDAQPPMPTLIAGDLNASAPYHPFDPDALPPHRRARLADRDYQLDHTVIQRLLDAGYIDAHRQTHTDAPPPHTFTTGFPALKLDYIFISPDLSDRLVDADVETGGFAPYCSDHYPVWAQLRPPKD